MPWRTRCTRPPSLMSTVLASPLSVEQAPTRFASARRTQLLAALSEHRRETRVGFGLSRLYNPSAATSRPPRSASPSYAASPPRISGRHLPPPRTFNDAPALSSRLPSYCPPRVRMRGSSSSPRRGCKFGPPIPTERHRRALTAVSLSLLLLLLPKPPYHPPNGDCLKRRAATTGAGCGCVSAAYDDKVDRIWHRRFRYTTPTYCSAPALPTLGTPLPAAAPGCPRM
ncbi:hypothetical protein DFH06DRAFT_1177371 [Mycena polygramma]|nr:hypothetical protein DFH06DRAFT_1177371 [Mycena polygramma]